MSKKTDRIRRATKARAKIKQLRCESFVRLQNTYDMSTPRSLRQMDRKCLRVRQVWIKKLRVRLNTVVMSMQPLLLEKLLAERAKKAGVSKVAFDRSGFKYHGRIKALADAAREQGMEF